MRSGRSLPARCRPVSNRRPASMQRFLAAVDRLFAHHGTTCAVSDLAKDRVGVVDRHELLHHRVMVGEAQRLVASPFGFFRRVQQAAIAIGSRRRRQIMAVGPKRGRSGLAISERAIGNAVARRRN